MGCRRFRCRSSTPWRPYGRFGSSLPRLHPTLAAPHLDRLRERLADPRVRPGGARTQLTFSGWRHRRRSRAVRTILRFRKDTSVRRGDAAFPDTRLGPPTLLTSQSRWCPRLFPRQASSRTRPPRRNGKIATCVSFTRLKGQWPGARRIHGGLDVLDVRRRRSLVQESTWGPRDPALADRVDSGRRRLVTPQTGHPGAGQRRISSPAGDLCCVIDRDSEVPIVWSTSCVGAWTPELRRSSRRGLLRRPLSEAHRRRRRPGPRASCGLSTGTRGHVRRMPCPARDHLNLIWHGSGTAWR